MTRPLRALPPGYDPDSYIREHGVAAFCALVGIPPPAPASRHSRVPGDAQHVRQVHERGASNRDIARPPVDVPVTPVLASAHGLRCQCYDCAWDRIGDYADRREGSAAWYAEGYADAWKARERAREEERRRRALADLRQRLAREHRGATPEARASAWLAYRSGDSSSAAFRAAVGLVRGFGLGVDRAFAMLESEYAPRFHRKLPRRELIGMVRRAERASMPWGKLLEEERR